MSFRFLSLFLQNRISVFHQMESGFWKCLEEAALGDRPHLSHPKDSSPEPEKPSKSSDGLGILGTHA
jgi:hypothetical protein